MSARWLWVNLLMVACESSPELVPDSGLLVEADTGIEHEDAATDGDASDASRTIDAGIVTPPQDAYSGPATLSETGLYAMTQVGELAADVVSYDVDIELYADGAEKRRFFSLPEGTRIDNSDPDAWRFPVGTRAWKEFSVDGVRIETRFLIKTGERRWEHVAYVWRSDQSDADAMPEGMVNAGGTEHDVPSIDGCYDCHRGTDGLLGISNFGIGSNDNELLAALRSRNALIDPEVDATVPGSDIERAALSYLHVNCGSCHDSRHPTGRTRPLSLRLRAGLDSSDRAPARLSALGTPMHHRIDGTTLGVVPGNPEASQLWVRMRHRGDGFEMPPRGSEEVDEIGSELIRAWIEGMR